MTIAFKYIGKRIDDFLKTKEYDLQRTAKINVSSDKVNWSLENKLNPDGAIDSELDVSHRFDRETLSLKTSTTKAPKFEVKSKRFESKFDLKACIQDPTLELNICQQRAKYTLCCDTTYDWANQNCEAELALSYSGVDRMVLGTKMVAKREGGKPLEVSDYNVGVQFNRNADQTFAVTTEKQFKKVKVGAEFQVRDSYRGFAQVSYQTADEETSPLGYSVGVQRNISDTASVRGVVRSDQTMSVLYGNNFTDSGVCAKVAANFDFTKEASQRASLQWKVIFGTGSASCCK